MMKLNDYCKQRGITMEELAEVTGVSRGMLYNIDNGANVSVDTINKIFAGTLKRFGVGLVAELYTNIYN